MPTNNSETVCLGCGAAPGSRHTASCPLITLQERFVADPSKIDPEILRGMDEIASSRASPGAPTPGAHPISNYELSRRTLAALETIAVAADAIARHLTGFDRQVPPDTDPEHPQACSGQTYRSPGSEPE